MGHVVVGRTHRVRVLRSKVPIVAGLFGHAAVDKTGVEPRQLEAAGLVSEVVCQALGDDERWCRSVSLNRAASTAAWIALPSCALPL